MKRATQKPGTTEKVISPLLKTLLQHIERAEQAAEKAYADYEQKHIAYKEAKQSDTPKNVFFKICSAMKIAKLHFEIRHTEYKLAKHEYKFAKKAAKRAGQKASIDHITSEGQASSQGKAKKIAPTG